MQPNIIPLPQQLSVRLTVKNGDPLTACRDKLPPIDFLFQVSAGYRGLRGTIEEMFNRQFPNVWRDEFQLYLKPSNHAPQRDFSVLQEGQSEFDMQLETVWHTARLRKNGQADFRLMIFVYIPRPPRATTLRHATATRIEDQAPRIAQFVREHEISVGPATQRYMSVRQARLPEEASIQTPEDPTFRQLQWIDEQEAAMRTEQDRMMQDTSAEYRVVRVIFEGTSIPLKMNVSDLRLALGLLSYPLRPPFRAPVVTSVDDPEVDMEDVDH
ncbi:hypothetical protein PPTG_20219 [Phytophthora nicotianae INRA-310]|uniref:Uncharacterized protein n=1 Tax=Phytophthora nicotianae (strain INRA-310) TaxID=761204 RepID=W2PBF7_PHYN3|nr:hypothetical protein PPTG_20219 [Phytophthora nicotianae INRA-310]ETM97568.1 hypothetical protein PPTG_20219 [Phytophthora nicotianae INRA-310]